MQLPVPVRRAVYRSGYHVLQVIWLLTGPVTHGVKCVITDEDRVLLVRHSYGRRWWDLPGGSMKRGEPPVQTARREMAEELGLEIADWETVGDLVAPSLRRRRDMLHCVRTDLDRPALRIDPGELLEARWFARSELPYNLSPCVIPIIARTTVIHRA